MLGRAPKPGHVHLVLKMYFVPQCVFELDVAGY